MALDLPRRGVIFGVGAFGIWVVAGEPCLPAEDEALPLPAFLLVGSLACGLFPLELAMAGEEIEAALLISSTVALVSSVTARINATMRAGRE
ncbi:MAG TPA: hypothetical protein VH349_06360 [Ktedonobacterales bacterium]